MCGERSSVLLAVDVLAEKTLWPRAEDIGMSDRTKTDGANFLKKLKLGVDFKFYLWYYTLAV